ncbi:MAG TPA: sigma 54-interacting transcriptional regulator [Bdellovibrionota bacterium]|nr:sigma 54-interacting transcriptional regulator [Bdellovibrionota bacterium]
MFEALDPQNHKECILKMVPKDLLSPADVVGLRKEFEYLSKFRHPNLVQVLDFGESDSWTWLVSEKVEGLPLRELTATVPESELISWGAVLLDTLAFLHDRGIVHHDIKPSNILIGLQKKPETLKLIDLGLATRHYVRGRKEGIRGTRGYFAPELLTAGSVDHRIDLYALGITLQRLLRGEPSSRFRFWLRKICQENPEERFPHAQVAKAVLLKKKDREVTLEPYLLDSLPWARCRSLWKRVSSECKTFHSKCFLLRGEESELSQFQSALRAELVRDGVEVKVARSPEEIDWKWPFQKAAQAAIIIYRGGDFLSPLEEWLKEVSVRTEGKVNIVWLEPNWTTFSPGQDWNLFHLGPLSQDELKGLLDELHPELSLEPQLIADLYSKTGGETTVLREVLQRLLQTHPSLEVFRQKLISDITTGEPISGTSQPTSSGVKDELFQIVLWGERALPTQWFYDAEDRLSNWIQSGIAYVYEQKGISFLKALVRPADDAPLRPTQIAWLEEKLSGPYSLSSDLLGLTTSLSLRAGLHPVSARAGGRLIRKFLRERKFEQALAWLDELKDVFRAAPQFLRTRLRLLVEIGRVEDAKSLAQSISPREIPKKLADRLAFLEGRYAECAPSPEVLIRMGRFKEAYEEAGQKLARAFVPKRKKAEYERRAGLAAYYCEDLDAALSHFSLSRLLWRRLNDIAGYTPTLNQLGMVYARMGRIKNALRCYRHAAWLSAQQGDRRRSLNYLLNLAILQVQTGDLEAAVRNFEKGRTAFRLLGLPSEQIIWTQNLANLWLRIGAVDKGARLVRESDSLVFQHGTPDQKIYQNVLRADIYSLRGDLKSFLSQVEALPREAPPPRFASAIQNLLAESTYLQGNLSRAIELLPRDAANLFHSILLRSEWEWKEKLIDHKELAKRYREGKEEVGKAKDCFYELMRLRFLGLIHQARPKNASPDDLSREVETLIQQIEKRMPPQILGPLRNQIDRWFVTEDKTVLEQTKAGDERSVSELRNEERTALRMFLKISHSVAEWAVPDQVIRAMLLEMIRLSRAARGGVILKKDDQLESGQFIGQKWEKEIDLPLELSRSVAKRAMEQNQTILLHDAREYTSSGQFGASLSSHDLRGILCIPLRCRGENFGAIYLDDPNQPFALSADDLELLQGITDQAAVTLHSTMLMEQIQKEQKRIQNLNESLEEMTLRLKQRISHLEEMRTPYGSSKWEPFGIVGASEAMRLVLQASEKAALSSSRILIWGETGTEKEALAKGIVAMSDRAQKPLVVIDCAAIPSALFEGELFGYEPGAFTGATSPRTGLLRSAKDGTLLLQGIQALSSPVQVKLLRVLQENKTRPLGGEAEYEVLGRWIATVDQNPKELIQKGTLREDLYFRLAAFEILIPPLRERKDDLPYLVRHLLRDVAQREGRAPKRISRAVLHRFSQYPWPGNIQELANELERASLTSEGDLIDLPDLSPPLQTWIPAQEPAMKHKRAFPKLRGTIEKKIIQKAIQQAKGNYRLAAERLSISLATFYRKLAKYEIQ